MKLPHPVVLLVAGVAVCAALTWVLPAGEYDRRDDPATGRSVVVAGTYHRVDPAPVGPFAAAVAVPRGFVAAADVIGVVLFVGAAWFIVDRIGTLGRLIAALVGRSAAAASSPSRSSRCFSRRWARSRTCRKRSSRSCPHCWCS